MSDGQPHLVPPHEHRCRFVKTSGARCTYPALVNKELCFDHDKRLQRARGKFKPCLPAEKFNMVPLISGVWVEDHHSILVNLNHIALALNEGSIDVRQAGAMTSLMRTCLKTLRQMRDIERVEAPVEAYVEEEGQAMALPDENPDQNAAANPDGQPTALPDAANADPAPPALNFNPETKEGRDNQHQRILWEYFSSDPAAGVISGLDLNWPGRPATFTPPPAHLDPGATLTLEAVAATPAESTQPHPPTGVTPVESTHTSKTEANPRLSHTYAKSRKIFSAAEGRTPPVRVPHPSRSCTSGVVRGPGCSSFPRAGCPTSARFSQMWDSTNPVSHNLA